MFPCVENSVTQIIVIYITLEWFAPSKCIFNSQLYMATSGSSYNFHCGSLQHTDRSRYVRTSSTKQMYFISRSSGGIFISPSHVLYEFSLWIISDIRLVISQSEGKSSCACLKKKRKKNSNLRRAARKLPDDHISIKQIRAEPSKVHGV